MTSTSSDQYDWAFLPRLKEGKSQYLRSHFRSSRSDAVKPLPPDTQPIPPSNAPKPVRYHNATPNAVSAFPILLGRKTLASIIKSMGITNAPITKIIAQAPLMKEKPTCTAD